MKFQIPDVKTILEGIASLMENDIEKKVEVSSPFFDSTCFKAIFLLESG